MPSSVHVDFFASGNFFLLRHADRLRTAQNVAFKNGTLRVRSFHLGCYKSVLFWISPCTEFTKTYIHVHEKELEIKDKKGVPQSPVLNATKNRRKRNIESVGLWEANTRKHNKGVLRSPRSDDYDFCAGQQRTDLRDERNNRHLSTPVNRAKEYKFVLSGRRVQTHQGCGSHLVHSAVATFLARATHETTACISQRAFQRCKEQQCRTVV